MKMMTLDQMKDKDIGKIGTADRDKYEFDLRMEVLGEMIKSVRKERKLTQEQLNTEEESIIDQLKTLPLSEQQLLNDWVENV